MRAFFFVDRQKFQHKMRILNTNSCITLLFAQTVMMLVIDAITTGDSHDVFFPIHIQVFESNGFRAFLSPATFPLVGLQFFAFHSNVNAPIRLMQNGRYEGVVTSADYNGYWLFDVARTKLRLNAGDVINYWAYVEVNGVGYKIDSRTFMVHADGSYSEFPAVCPLQIHIFAMCNFFPRFRFHVLPIHATNTPPTLIVCTDILPSTARFAVSRRYDEIQNWRQNQIFDNQIQHHKVNYYKLSGACVPRNANIIQLENFNETLVELARSTNHLQQLNEEISRLNLQFSKLSTTDRQRINYFWTEAMRNDYANAVDIR